MVSTYLDFYQYQRQPTGLVLGPYLGNQFRFTSTQAMGTTLTVPASAVTVPLNPYDSLYIFDGPNSEVVQVANETAIASTSISLVSATQYQHAAGVPVCSDGSVSLGFQLFEASRQIEDICFQALWSTNYTSETLTLPTMRASIDNQGYIHFRPRHFPVTALTSVTVKQRQQNALAYDPAQAIMDSDQQTVDIPLDAVLPASGQSNNNASIVYQPYLKRTSDAWITLAYTAGFPVGQLPPTVVQAATLLTNDLLGLPENPMGADSIQQNKRKVEFVMRGDTSGQSLLYKKAVGKLAPYTVKSF